MSDLIQIVLLILGVLKLLVFVHVIVSLLISFQVLNARQPLVAAIWQGLERLFQPIYDPIRRIMPDTRPLDLSPIVLLVLIQIVEVLIT